MQFFKPKLESLPASQRKLWKEMGSTPREFVLYGGTALTLHLGHRQSEDFDFFSTEPFSMDALLRGVSYLKGATVLQQLPDTLTCAVARETEVKISFFARLKLKRVKDPLMAEDTYVRVASLLDIAGTKVGVVQSRPFYRDYFDIYALMEAGISLPEALSAAQVIYGNSFNPRVSLKALAFFEDGDLHRLPLRIRERLTAEAQRIDPDRLPRITASDEGAES